MEKKLPKFLFWLLDYLNAFNEILFMKYFSCLKERTKILPIDGYVEFSQAIDISNSISSKLMREIYNY